MCQLNAPSTLVGPARIPSVVESSTPPDDALCGQQAEQDTTHHSPRFWIPYTPIILVCLVADARLLRVITYYPTTCAQAPVGMVEQKQSWIGKQVHDQTGEL